MRKLLLLLLLLPLLSLGQISVVNGKITNSMDYKTTYTYDTVKVFFVYADTTTVSMYYFDRDNRHAINPYIKWAVGYEVTSNIRVTEADYGTAGYGNILVGFERFYLDERKKPISKDCVVLISTNFYK